MFYLSKVLGPTSVPLFPNSVKQAALSKAMCWQLDGTKGLTFVPAYRLLFQVADFARNTTGREQRFRARDPLL